MIYDSEGQAMMTVAEWCRRDGEVYQTVIKRRTASGLGMRSGASWYLTADEWEDVRLTPLSGSKTIRGPVAGKGKARKGRK